MPQIQSPIWLIWPSHSQPQHRSTPAHVAKLIGTIGASKKVLTQKKNWVLNIGQSGSTYLFLWWMWSISGWRTRASLGQRRPRMISTIICMKRWYITPTIGSWYGVQIGVGGQLLTLTMKPLMTRTNCLDGSMVLPDVEFLYMSPPLKRGGIIRMGQRHNTFFKAIARSDGRRWRICVRILRTHMRSKMKYGSVTSRKTVPIFHILCIAHMNFSEKYIIIKSLYIYIFMPSMQNYCWYKFDDFLCSLQYVLYMQHSNKNTPQLRVTANSIEDKVH